jgi:hypothetical protein
MRKCCREADQRSLRAPRSQTTSRAAATPQTARRLKRYSRQWNRSELPYGVAKASSARASSCWGDARGAGGSVASCTSTVCFGHTHGLAHGEHRSSGSGVSLLKTRQLALIADRAGEPVPDAQQDTRRWVHDVAFTKPVPCRHGPVELAARCWRQRAVSGPLSRSPKLTGAGLVSLHRSARRVVETGLVARPSQPARATGSHHRGGLRQPPKLGDAGVVRRA